ncbi:MAG: SIMPL domain-containing protein [Actinomycetota bacterium]
MRRTWTAVALVVAAAIIGASVLGAQALADDGGDNGGSTDRTITVTSTASVGSEPDEAVVTLGVSTQDPDSATALGRNGDTVDAVVAAVEGAGVAKEDVRTTRLDLSRRTIHRRTPQEATVYVADSALEITVREMDTVGDVIQAGVEAGATSVRGVRFGVSDPATARTEALDAAVRGARMKADAMAAAAGTTVTGVVTIDEQGASQPRYAYAGDAAYAAVPAALSAQVVPPDQIQTQVTVIVTWAIG